MKRSRKGGFTIVEVLIAIIMLSIGVLALASSSGSITRMMHYGRMKTDATAIGQSVLDSLRYRAQSTTPKCTSVVTGSQATAPKLGFTTNWTVATSGNTRNVMVAVRYWVGTRLRADTLRTTFYCQ
ncbi:MAG TPA: prepilin-type N-terminal cleavage/methylation domain-containing protein [Gemmatimonadales bacterium]|nr:prepilin-type N-terminal cleavage/methylation domain-containing protein [Gemmatimonadales bacterium]